jgi:hypothetical protein
MLCCEDSPSVYSGYLLFLNAWYFVFANIKIKKYIVKKSIRIIKTDIYSLRCNNLMKLIVSMKKSNEKCRDFAGIKIIPTFAFT